MPGFVPCKTDLERIAKSEELQKMEQANRAAIRNGEKVYDYSGFQALGK